ncbi:MAG TPA: DUF2264 domain-containing protein [Bacillota bacterium]
MIESTPERDYWVDTLVGISGPVLKALAGKRLMCSMPTGGAAGEREERREFLCLEALGRTLVGIAPWLEGDEGSAAENERREEYRILARQAIAAATDPASPDCANFRSDFQPIVDAAFLAHALLRAPRELWHKLDNPVKVNLIRGLKATRTRKPFFCNWLLFAAMIETFLAKAGEDWDPMRVDYAIKQHEQWYLGDGVYGDGPEFHWDYYNSFVIQPMLVDIVSQIGSEYAEWNELKQVILQRASRYAAVLERLISPEGTFPPIGRSLAYRFGAFQLLAQMALEKNLPPELKPSQVRTALTAVIKRVMRIPGTFDDQGWLKIGFCGSQDGIGESYISTGSLYLCTTAFLPLGLSPDEPFWKDPARDWTAKRIWSGENLPADHAINKE